MKEIGNVYRVELLIEGSNDTWPARCFVADKTVDAVGMADAWLKTKHPGSGIVLGNVALVACNVIDRG